MLGLIKQLWLESGYGSGYRKIHKDLRELGETCGINRVARLMKQEGLKVQVGYNKPRYKGGKVAILADNHLKQDFDVEHPIHYLLTNMEIGRRGLMARNILKSGDLGMDMSYRRREKSFWTGGHNQQACSDEQSKHL